MYSIITHVKYPKVLHTYIYLQYIVIIEIVFNYYVLSLLWSSVVFLCQKTRDTDI